MARPRHVFDERGQIEVVVDVGLDRANKTVLLRDRPPIPFDVCSVNIGSAPQATTFYFFDIRPLR